MGQLGAMSTTQHILIEDILLGDRGLETQLRERTSDEAIERYAEAIERGDRLPAIELVPTGDGSYFIADGWHRVFAHVQVGRGLIEAIVLPVVSGVDPLLTAKRYALRANQKHGLPLNKGDQRKRAEVALLMPDFSTFKLRALGKEIGVSKSTLGRVRMELVRKGILPAPGTDEALPDYIPYAYASDHKLSDDPFNGDHDLKEEAYKFVRKLNAIDPRDWEFEHADDARDGKHTITHRGVIEGKAIKFFLEGNSVQDGMPTHYEQVPDEPDAHTPRTLTREELDRLEEVKAKREFFAARDRLLRAPDPKLRAAVRTLARYREEPKLWTDLRAFIRAGGPAEEHTYTAF